MSQQPSGSTTPEAAAPTMAQQVITALMTGPFVYGIARLENLEEVELLDIPCALIAGPNIFLRFLVCADGSMALVEDGYIDDDGDDVDPATTPLDPTTSLLDALAAGPIVASRGAWTLAGLPVPKRRKPKADPVHNMLPDPERDERLQPLVAWATTAGGNGPRVADRIAAIADTFRDPPLLTEEETNWDEAAVTRCQAVLLDILDSDSRIDEETFVVLRSAGPDGPAHINEIDHPEGEAIAQRAIGILERLLDLEAMRGTSYEYNDGAYGRRSGYYQINAAIVTCNAEPQSAHARLSARKRLRDALRLAGVDDTEVDRLIA